AAAGKTRGRESGLAAFSSFRPHRGAHHHFTPFDGLVPDESVKRCAIPRFVDSPGPPFREPRRHLLAKSSIDFGPSARQNISRLGEPDEALLSTAAAPKRDGTCGGRAGPDGPTD